MLRNHFNTYPVSEVYQETYALLLPRLGGPSFTEGGLPYWCTWYRYSDQNNPLIVWLNAHDYEKGIFLQALYDKPNVSKYRFGSKTFAADVARYLVPMLPHEGRAIWSARFDFDLLEYVDHVSMPHQGRVVPFWKDEDEKVAGRKAHRSK